MSDQTQVSLPLFCGGVVTEEQVSFVRGLIQRYRHLSRTELVATVCELLGWVRKDGQPKVVEGLAYLENLAQQQRLELPALRPRRVKRTAVVIDTTTPVALPVVHAALRALPPVSLQRPVTAAQRGHWRSLVERYHALGHKIPFGAHLRYFIQADAVILGCLQFSSPAWRLRCRDQWIGWTEAQRQARLQHVVCNSRFLILPGVVVPNLASHALALAARVVARDWVEHYHVRPWLLESLTDPSRFRGTSYRAANWLLAGTTSGRGRDDGAHQRHGAAPKRVWLYPLHPRCREHLCGGAQ